MGVLHLAFNMDYAFDRVRCVYFKVLTNPYLCRYAAGMLAHSQMQVAYGHPLGSRREADRCTDTAEVTPKNICLLIQELRSNGAFA
jgi:hypothetical protein